MEINDKHDMAIQELRAELLATNVKLDTHYVEYMNKLTTIEAQTIKTNGRVNLHDRLINVAIGGGSMLLLVPTLNAIVTKLSQ